MSARILVVDDIPTNRLLLEARLATAYYQVSSAANGPEALALAASEKPDLILLDVMMPDMDGFEVCQRLKADRETAHIPVVMVTALDSPADRVRGLEAGADDFLTKPVDGAALFARVRNLVRVKMMIDELRLREETFDEFSVSRTGDAVANDDVHGRILVACDKRERAMEIADQLKARMDVEVDIAVTAAEALSKTETAPPDAFIVGATFPDGDGLRVCSQIRSTPQARQCAVIYIAKHDDPDAVAAALDLGATDYIEQPIDPCELTARMRSQLRRKHYSDRLRLQMRDSIKMAVTDPLTGLYNRRYGMSHLETLIHKAEETETPLTVLLFDLDRFKQVNDEYGHAAGDAVLVEFAARVRNTLRNVDMVARIGGEEFLAALPDADEEEAKLAAERIRAAVAGAEFVINNDGGALAVTVSIGAAMSRGADEPPEDLMKRADDALYGSKNAGRDCVTFAATNEAA